MLAITVTPILKTPHLDRMSCEGSDLQSVLSAAAMCGRLEEAFTQAAILSVWDNLCDEGNARVDGDTNHVRVEELDTQQGISGNGIWARFRATLEIRTAGERLAKRLSGITAPPWERDVDVSFVTESKVPTWDPLIHPGPIKDNEKEDPKIIAMKGQPYRNDYFVGEGQVETVNMEGDDSRVIMDRAIPFIRDAVASDTPFFAVIWFHAPHSPVVGGEEFLKQYAQVEDEDARHYYACITALDAQMGRLRANWMLLAYPAILCSWYCSDNGPARQGSPRHVGTAKYLSGYKLSIQEGGSGCLDCWYGQTGRVPKTVEAPCVTTDYFPTILGALG